ncbi:unnamed protein product, partial [Closterium sp. Naga37s-1]
APARCSHQVLPQELSTLPLVYAHQVATPEPNALLAELLLHIPFLSSTSPHTRMPLYPTCRLSPPSAPLYPRYAQRSYQVLNVVGCGVIWYHMVRWGIGGVCMCEGSASSIAVLVPLSQRSLAKMTACSELLEAHLGRWCCQVAHGEALNRPRCRVSGVAILDDNGAHRLLESVLAEAQRGREGIMAGGAGGAGGSWYRGANRHHAPTTISLPPPSHSHHHLTPTTISLPPPSHSHHHLTPTTISLPPPSHSHHHLTPAPPSLPGNEACSRLVPVLHPPPPPRICPTCCST